jgi:hypothetical protein
MRGGKVMLNLFRKLNFSLLLFAILISSAVVFAANAPTTSQVPVTVTITALGQNSAPAQEIHQEDVTAFSEKTRLNITGWAHAEASDAGLQLAILLDNNLGTSSVGRQMQELSDFITSEPASTQVGVFYAENGAADAATPFTGDHAAAAKSIHLTAGRQGGSPSIYLSLSDLVSHWPATASGRREALVIASGFDPLQPGVEDSYADAAIQDAERAGINVHIIMIPRPQYENSFGDNISEAKLIEAAKGSGGQVLFEGAFVPVSFKPYLEQLNTVLNNQYLLTFTIDPSKHKDGDLRPFRVQTEDRGVKLVAPQQVFVPAS